ncbi:MAG: hypothetical protein IT323_02715 [Anaerolineae bacterium]|nr:hypothetical protein [Anaerolineae bacterium]
MSDYPDERFAPYEPDDDWEPIESDESDERGFTPPSGATPVKPPAARPPSRGERPIPPEQPVQGRPAGAGTGSAPRRRTGSTPIAPPPGPAPVAPRGGSRTGASDRPAIPRQEHQQRRERQSRPLPVPPDPERGIRPDQAPVYPDARGRRRPTTQRISTSKRDSGLYLPWWSLLLMLIFVGAAAVGAWAVVGMMGEGVTPGGQTPVVIVVTATYTAGPPATATSIPLPPTDMPPVILPTIAPTNTLPPGDFRIGITVEVVGVGPDGLNVRSEPGTDPTTIRYQAPEGSRFVIRGGPQTASGLEWWDLQDVTDPTRPGGWAARPYLQQAADQ